MAYTPKLTIADQTAIDNFVYDYSDAVAKGAALPPVPIGLSIGVLQPVHFEADVSNIGNGYFGIALHVVDPGTGKLLGTVIGSRGTRFTEGITDPSQTPGLLTDILTNAGMGLGFKTKAATDAEDFAAQVYGQPQSNTTGSAPWLVLAGQSLGASFAIAQADFLQQQGSYGVSPASIQADTIAAPGIASYIKSNGGDPAKVNLYNADYQADGLTGPYGLSPNNVGNSSDQYIIPVPNAAGYIPTKMYDLLNPGLFVATHLLQSYGSAPSSMSVQQTPTGAVVNFTDANGYTISSLRLQANGTQLTYQGTAPDGSAISVTLTTPTGVLPISSPIGFNAGQGYIVSASTLSLSFTVSVLPSSSAYQGNLTQTTMLLATINGRQIDAGLAGQLAALGITPQALLTNSVDLATGAAVPAGGVPSGKSGAPILYTQDTDGNPTFTFNIQLGNVVVPAQITLIPVQGQYTTAAYEYIDPATGSPVSIVGGLPNGNAVSQMGYIDSTGSHIIPATDQPAPTSPFAEKALSVGNAILSEVIQLELGKNVPAALVTQALASSIVTNLQKSNLVLSGVSAKGLATSFGVDLAGGVGSYLGGQLGAELARDIGVDPRLGGFVGGQLGLLAGDEVAGAILGKGVTFASLAGPGGGGAIAQTFSQGGGVVGAAPSQANDAIVFNPYSALGSFAGEELASLIDPATTKDAATGGELGAVVGAAIGQAVILVPFVGAFIGAFAGELLGTVLGLYIGGPPPNPLALDEVQLTAAGTFGSGGLVLKHLDAFPGLDRTATMLGNQASSTVNSILAPIGGRVADLLQLGTFNFGVSGFFDSAHQHLAYNGGDGTAFDDPQVALEHGVLLMLQQIQVEGGDIYLKRALYADLNGVNLDAMPNQQVDALFQTVVSDQQVAQVYEQYEQNPLLFDAGLANADAATQAGWVDIVARAQQLGLSNPAPSDNYSQVEGTAAFWAAGGGTVAPSHGTDTVTASGKGYVLNAGNDVDHLVATNAIGDILNGGPEDDTINADGLSDTLTAGTGNSTLTATGTDNTLIAGSGTDILAATGTGNILAGSTGAVTMTVNGDSNALIADAGPATLTATGKLNLLQGGSGTDTLAASGTQNALTAGSGNATLTATGTQNVLTAGSGLDTLTVNGSQNQVYGGAGEATVSLNGNGNTVKLGAGAATVNIHGDGNSVTGSDGTESLAVRGSGNTLVAGKGALSGTVAGLGNTLTGSTGADDAVTLLGDNDRFIAGGGRDTLAALGKDDVLVAGSGNDTLSGGGSDIYLLGDTAGQDTITPGAGDTLRFDSSVGNGNVRFTASGNDLLVTLVATGEVITVKDDLSELAPGVVVSKLAKVAFADGTSVNLENGITFTWDGTAGGVALAGSSYGGNLFLAGPGDTLTGGVGASTYLVDAKSGAVTIRPGAFDVLAFAPDVDPASVLVSASGAGLMFTIADTGTTVQVLGDLAVNPQGIETTLLQHVRFLSNGATWTGAQLLGDAGLPAVAVPGLGAGNQGNGSSLFVGTPGAALTGDTCVANTYFFDTGFGTDTIAPGTFDTVEFSHDVFAADISLQAQGQNLLIVNNLTGDVVQVTGNFSTGGSGVHSAVRQVLFADGTSIDLTKPAPFTWDGSDGDQTLTGSAYGANLYYGGDGDTLVGAPGGQNTYVFGASAGTETITPGSDDMVEFDASVSPSDILVQAVGTTLVLKDQTNGGSLNFLGAAGARGTVIPPVGMVKFADGTVWDLRQGLRFTWDGSAGNTTVQTDPNGTNTVIAGGNDTLIGSAGSSTYRIGYGVEGVQIDPGPCDVIRFGQGVSPSNIEFEAQGNDLLILGSEDQNVIADIHGDLSDTPAAGLVSAVRSLQFTDGTSVSLSTVLTYAWNDRKGGATLEGTSWGNNFFNLGVADTADGSMSHYENTYRYGINDGNTTILPGGSDVIEFSPELTSSDVSWAASGNDLIVTILPTNKTIDVVGDRLKSGEAVLRFSDGTVVVPDLSTSTELPVLPAPVGPLSGPGANGVKLVNGILVGSDSIPNTYLLDGSGDPAFFGAAPNTVVFDKGVGFVEIFTQGHSGVIDVGSGISASDVIFQAFGGSLTIALRDDPADKLYIVSSLHILPGGGFSSDVAKVAFADGTSIDLNAATGITSTWIGADHYGYVVGGNYGPNVFELQPTGKLVFCTNTVDGIPDQNTFYFGRGDGQAIVEPHPALAVSGGYPGILYLRAGIAASDVLVQVGNGGDLTVALADDPSDSITFMGAVSGSPTTGVTSLISDVVLADGSTISLTSPAGPVSTWIVGADRDAAGSNYGSNVFELAQGSGGSILFGNGSGGGSNQNSVYFSRGDGAVTVSVEGAPGTLYLGPGISASDVLVQAAQSGDPYNMLRIGLKDDPTDTIVFHDDLSNPASGVHSLIGSILCADGTTIDLNPSTGPVSTWTQEGATGSGFGPNVFDLPQGPGGIITFGTGTVSFGTGPTGGSNQNTVYYNQGDGNVLILADGSPGIINMGPGITASDLVLTDNVHSDIVISFRGDPTDSLAIDGTLNWNRGGTGVSSAVTNIMFADGSTLDLNAPSGPTFTWIGTATSTFLAGVGYGPNVFNCGPGGDQIYFGTGNGGGSNQNTVYFDKGDGDANAQTNGAPGVLHLGADITPSDVVLQAQGNSLSVQLRDDPTDSITFGGDLHGLTGGGGQKRPYQHRVRRRLQYRHDQPCRSHLDLGRHGYEHKPVRVRFRRQRVRPWPWR